MISSGRNDIVNYRTCVLFQFPFQLRKKVIHNQTVTQLNTEIFSENLNFVSVIRRIGDSFPPFRIHAIPRITDSLSLSFPAYARHERFYVRSRIMAFQPASGGSTESELRSIRVRNISEYVNLQISICCRSYQGRQTRLSDNVSAAESLENYITQGRAWRV